MRTRCRSVRAFTLILAAIGAGCAGPGVRVAEVGGTNAEVARETYTRACASCHGPDGRGDGPDARTLRVPPADLTTLAARHSGRFPRDYVVAVIAGAQEVPAHGPREMPVWRERFGGGDGASAAATFYTQRRLQLVTDYVGSLQRVGGVPVSPVPR